MWITSVLYTEILAQLCVSQYLICYWFSVFSGCASPSSALPDCTYALLWWWSGCWKKPACTEDHRCRAAGVQHLGVSVQQCGKTSRHEVSSMLGLDLDNVAENSIQYFSICVFALKWVIKYIYLEEPLFRLKGYCNQFYLNWLE